MQNTPEKLDIKLNDITPIMDIQEYSFYYFLGISIFALLIIFGLFYFIYKLVKSKKVHNRRKEDKKLIDLLNLNDTKKSAYLFTLAGATFKDDSQRHNEMYENIVQRLENYKYKKQVDEFDSEVINYINLYKEMVDA